MLVYAHIARFSQHERAHEWLEGQLNAGVRVGLLWVVMLAFVRLTTNPRMFPNPESIDSAWTRIETWLDWNPVWIPEPTALHRDTLAALLQADGVQGKDATDAHRLHSQSSMTSRWYRLIGASIAFPVCAGSTHWPPTSESAYEQNLIARVSFYSCASGSLVIYAAVTPLRRTPSRRRRTSHRGRASRCLLGQGPPSLRCDARHHAR